MELYRKFRGQNSNKNFVNFVNVLYEAVSSNNVSWEALWDLAKKYRLDYIVDAECEKDFFSDLPITISNAYLNFFSSALNINSSHGEKLNQPWLTDTADYKESVKNSEQRKWRVCFVSRIFFLLTEKEIFLYHWIKN